METPTKMTHPEGARKKAYVETFGCQMNVSDGELMQGILAAQGYEITTAPDDADVVLVNTCAIREHAEQRVLGRVGQLNQFKRARPGVILGVTGCMAQRMGETLLEQAPYVDLVLGPDSYRRLPEVLARVGAGETEAVGKAAGGENPVAHSQGAHGLRGALTGTAAARGAAESARARRGLPVLSAEAVASGGKMPGSPESPASGDNGALASGAIADRASTGYAPATAPSRLAMLDFEPHENYEGLEIRRGSGVSAWVPVQRGCNYRCTYCIVPYVRGDEKNREPERILAEVAEIVAQGTPEVVLLGQSVNSYQHGDWDFSRLLRAVARVDGIRRVRFTSPHPNDFTDSLVEVMAEEPTVCKHLHLPVQSGHNRTLKRMLRRYTVETYLEKVHQVRAAIPEIALSTDIIVAFPGETEEEYEATLDLVREVRFDEGYLYKYSPREGTPATRLPAEQFIPEEVAQQRLERLIALQRGIMAELNQAEVGRTVEVLIERVARSEGDLLGRTETNKMVVFPGEPAAIGSFARVRLTGTTGPTFRGTLVDRIPTRESRVA
jgi:tRNA-2-methylthio-N6-dimethylallyladenosine synthase